MTEQERVTREGERGRETEGERRQGREFKFKGIKEHKDARDYNMKTAEEGQREMEGGRSGAESQGHHVNVPRNLPAIVTVAIAATFF